MAPLPSWTGRTGEEAGSLRDILADQAEVRLVETKSAILLKPADHRTRDFDRLAVSINQNHRMGFGICFDHSPILGLNLKRLSLQADFPSVEITRDLSPDSSPLPEAISGRFPDPIAVVPVKAVE
jgi:hypothetical protein